MTIEREATAAETMIKAIMSIIPLDHDDSLSPQETSVVMFIVESYTYDEIGDAMGISPRTVKEYAVRARKKLCCASNREVQRLVVGVLTSSRAASCPQ